MKTGKSIIDYKKKKKDISFTHNMEKSYNEITVNPNKSFQPTETAGFEFSRFDFSNVSATVMKLDFMFIILAYEHLL